MELSDYIQILVIKQSGDELMRVTFTRLFKPQSKASFSRMELFKTYDLKNKYIQKSWDFKLI